MAYPTTLALIAALWGPGPGRTRSIALWAAIGGAISVSGPLLSGLLLQFTTWPWVFFIVIPLAVAALFMAWKFIPAHVNEATEPVDNLGGILSVVLVGTFVLSINFLPLAGYQKLAIGLLVVAIIAGVLFVLRQRRAKNPLYDLKVASRPTFWVAAVAGIIVFGALMGAMFIGQQYMQDVLGFGTVEAALPALFAGAFMILAAPRSAQIVETRGSRFTLLAGYVFVFLGFLTMLLLWQENASFWAVVLAFVFVGIGIGLSGTPASRSLTGSVPVTRVGMASGTADLQRDLGGALFNSLFGALLAAGYAAAMTAAHCGCSARRGGATRRGQRPDHVLRGCDVGGSSVSPVCHADHGGGQVLVPGRRSICLYRGHHRGAHRGGARVLHLPQAGQRA